MGFLTCKFDLSTHREKSFSMSTREIVSTLMNSPFYFSIPVVERKEMVDHVRVIVGNNEQKEYVPRSTIELKFLIKIKKLNFGNFFNLSLSSFSSLFNNIKYSFLLRILFRNPG